MLQGALRFLHNGGSEDALQPLVYLAHPIDRGCKQRVQNCGCCCHVFAGPGKGGELSLHALHHHGPARLQHRLALV
jgi:hypothetical protein